MKINKPPLSVFLKAQINTVLKINSLNILYEHEGQCDSLVLLISLLSDRQLCEKTHTQRHPVMFPPPQMNRSTHH